jgi:hypothetical protein
MGAFFFAMGYCFINHKGGDDFLLNYLWIRTKRILIVYTGLLHTHRLVAYLFLLGTLGLVLLALYRRLSGKDQHGTWMTFMSKLSLIAGHTQLLIGLGLYFVGPWFEQLTSNTAEVMKNADLRWFAVEHISANIAGIVLITIGNSKFKKATSSASEDKAVLVFFGLGLLLILSRIPWERLF